MSDDLVLDASLAVSVVTTATPAAKAVRQRLLASTVHAPHLLDAEVGSVLRRQVRTGDVAADRAAGGLRALATLVDRRYPHVPLADAAWALRNNVSYTDALYVALATRLGAPLLTSDLRLARAPGLTCVVETIT